MLRRVLIIAAVMAVALAATARDVAVVTRKPGNLQAITVQDLVRICSGKLNKWPDGKEVKMFVPDPSSPSMKTVAEKIFKLNSEDFRSLLQKTAAVKVLTTDQAVVAAVQDTPNSIGLVDIYSINGAVTVLHLEDKLPFEPGYILHRSQ